MIGQRLPGFGPEVAQGYLTDQLIAYIGNKRRLLGLIGQAIARTGVAGGGTLLDAFAGSGSVSRLAKTLGLRVVANDWEPYTRFINSTYIAQNRLPGFEALGGAEAAYSMLNALEPQPGYISKHYCPADDDAPDLDRERMFFTQCNGRKLDAMRERVEWLWLAGDLTPPEHDMLVASLVWAASWCSNTSGVFKGFHRGWGGATRTAWYRIKAPVAVHRPVLCDNGLENLVLQQDAAEAARATPCDVAYLDPPYNQHQYGSNYHLLNTMALWDKPPVSPTFGPGDKSAIRTDWRTRRNSAYCRKRHAPDELRGLLSALRARWILMSYSLEGTIVLPELLEILGAEGRLDWVCRPYKRYRVSSQRPSPRTHTLEFVLIVDREGKPDPAAADRILASANPAVV